MKRYQVKPLRGDSGKKKRKADVEDNDTFFLADEDDKAKKSDSEEEGQQEETAEERRLRLAKEYIQQLREVDDGDFVGVTGQEADAGPDEGRDHLADRLAKDAAEAVGRLQRKLASRVVIPEQVSEPLTSTSGRAGCAGAGQFHRCHRLAATALALTTDDATAFTVAKDGTIFKWDVETGKKTQLFRPGDKPASDGTDRTADWLKNKARQASTAALLAVAVSSDGKFLAVGGGDKKVHVFDAESGAYVQEYRGHRDVVTGLVFREGTHQLLSCSLDRTVKIWSLDDRAYVDSLFGHQASTLAIDMLRNERAVTGGEDRTCRVWKIPEESQLVFRPPTQAVDCCRYITNTEWLSGASNGSLQVWSQMKKKPVSVIHHAHGPGSVFTAGASSAGFVEGDCSGWVQSVAACRGSDLVASGAGDGLIRLWQVEANAAVGGAQGLKWIGGLPARGFVNGLQIARSGRFVVAAIGQEPRMGRWARDPKSRNGLLIHTLELADES